MVALTNEIAGGLLSSPVQNPGDGGRGNSVAVPTPFLTPRFSRYVHAGARPTRHEWLTNLRHELGEHAVCPCGAGDSLPFHPLIIPATEL